jgi:hypothetical protein
MKFLKLTALVLAAFCISAFSFADEPAKTDTLLLSRPINGAETLSGQLGNKAGEKGAKKGKKTSSSELVLHVSEHHGKKKTDKGAQHGKSVTLTATGDILKQLNEFAHKHAHVKVSGSLNGDTMTVTSVSEEHHKGKGK